jgi:hypothetical protein
MQWWRGADSVVWRVESVQLPSIGLGLGHMIGLTIFLTFFFFFRLLVLVLP